MKMEKRKIPGSEEPGILYNKSGDDLLSHTVTRAVPLAQEGLTAEFGMGSGVTPPLWSPEFQSGKVPDIVVMFKDLIDAPGIGVNKILC
jgi:hypothetical protein